MTKLETLYASIKGLQDLGLPLDEETLENHKGLVLCNHSVNYM